MKTETEIIEIPVRVRIEYSEGMREKAINWARKNLHLNGASHGADGMIRAEKIEEGEDERETHARSVGGRAKIIQAIANHLHTVPGLVSVNTNLALIGLGGYSLQRVMWDAGVDVSLSECANLFERVSCLLRYADAYDARRGPAKPAVP